MKYPIDVTVPPAIMRGADKTWIVAGCMISVPPETTSEDFHKWVRYIPPTPPNSVWSIRSSSGGSYTVRRWPNDRWVCSCPGFRYHKRCKHIDKAKK